MVELGNTKTGFVFCLCFAFFSSAWGGGIEVKSVCDGGDEVNTHSLSDDDIDALIADAESGSADAAYIVAQYYSHSSDDPLKTRRWLEVASSKQCLMAKYKLGISYLRGKAGYADEVEKGERLLAEVYEQGLSYAATNLGYFFYREESKNYKKSRHWFEKAAAAGHTNAMYQLAQLYLTGKGGKKEPQKVYALSLILSTRVSPTSEMWEEFVDWRVQSISQLSVSEIQEATDLFLNDLWVLPCAPEGDGAYCLEIKADYEENIEKRRKAVNEWRSKTEVKLFKNQH
jgi:hypothetical protein